MNIRSLKFRSTKDTDDELKKAKDYFNSFLKFDKTYQIEVKAGIFEIFDNQGNSIVAFSTNAVLKILEQKGII